MATSSKQRELQHAITEDGRQGRTMSSGITDSRPSAKKLQRHVIPHVATKWYELGLELLDEKEEHELNNIKSNYGSDVKKCCLEMFLLWLNANSDADWWQIVEALKSPGVELSATAAELERKLSVKHAVPSQAAVDSDQSMIESCDYEYLNFAEFEDVSLAFSALLSRLQKEIKIKDFVIIRNACVARASQKLSEQIKKTQDVDSLFQLFADNKAYCNWMNIRFLEVIANASGNSKLVNLVKDYKKVIYSKTLREVWDCIPYHTVRTKYYSRLQVKFDGKDPDNVTIEQLMRFCEPYIVKDIAMLIAIIEEGSLKVTWFIPTDEVQNCYLAALMLPQESRLDSYLQIGDWIVHHPLLVLQNLHKEYPTILPSALLIGYYYGLLLKHIDANFLVDEMFFNGLMTFYERELILTGQSVHQRNKILLDHIQYKQTRTLMSFCELVQDIAPRIGLQLLTALKSHVTIESQYYALNITNESSTVKSYNHPSSLHMLFLKAIDQIEEILQLSDSDFLLEECKSVLASEIHRINLFSTTCINILDDYNNPVLILRYLSFLFTWSNHSILRALLSFTSKAIHLLDEFDSLLDPFNIIVSYPIPRFSSDMILSRTSEYTLLAIRCNKELWQCSLQYVLYVQSFIVEKCDITQHCLQLLAVNSDPTIFYWTIPKCVVELIESNVLQHSEYLYSQGIIEVLVYPKRSLATGDDIMVGSLAFTTEKEIAVKRLKLQEQLSPPNEDNIAHSVSIAYGDLHEGANFKRKVSKKAEEIISRFEKMRMDGGDLTIHTLSSPVEKPQKEENLIPDISQPTLPLMTMVQQRFSEFPLDESVLTLGQDGYYLEDRDYNIVGTAGYGGSSRCYLGNDKVKCTQFIIKRPKKSYSEEEKQDLMRESRILQKINHDNVIRFYGLVEDLQDHSFKIFLEYPEGTCADIHHVFCESEDKDNFSGNIVLIMLYVQQILFAVDYLHWTMGILHLNIKGENVIVCNGGYKVKLKDFATACKANSVSLKSGWTPVFAAPEINNQSQPPTFSADIWSAMCVAVEMVTGNFPWPNKDAQDVVAFKTYEDNQITELVEYDHSDYWDKYSYNEEHHNMYQELVNMWKMVFRKDSSSRPSANYLLNLKWMKEMEINGESILYELVSGEEECVEQSYSMEDDTRSSKLYESVSGEEECVEQSYYMEDKNLGISRTKSVSFRSSKHEPPINALNASGSIMDNINKVDTKRVNPLAYVMEGLVLDSPVWFPQQSEAIPLVPRVRRVETPPQQQWHQWSGSDVMDSAYRLSFKEKRKFRRHTPVDQLSSTRLLLPDREQHKPDGSDEPSETTPHTSYIRR